MRRWCPLRPLFTCCQPVFYVTLLFVNFTTHLTAKSSCVLLWAGGGAPRRRLRKIAPWWPVDHFSQYCRASTGKLKMGTSGMATARNASAFLLLLLLCPSIAVSHTEDPSDNEYLLSSSSKVRTFSCVCRKVRVFAQRPNFSLILLASDFTLGI